MFYWADTFCFPSRSGQRACVVIILINFIFYSFYFYLEKSAGPKEDEFLYSIDVYTICISI
jgi:hypothetical protein